MPKMSKKVSMESVCLWAWNSKAILFLIRERNMCRGLTACPFFRQLRVDHIVVLYMDRTKLTRLWTSLGLRVVNPKRIILTNLSVWILLPTMVWHKSRVKKYKFWVLSQLRKRWGILSVSSLHNVHLVSLLNLNVTSLSLVYSTLWARKKSVCPI